MIQLPPAPGDLPEDPSEKVVFLDTYPELWEVPPPLRR
jgi:hypothetical protein